MKRNNLQCYRSLAVLLSMAALMIPALPLFSGTVNAAAMPIIKTNVQFKGDSGLPLHGTLVAPATPGLHPGLVMIGGAGPQKRTELSSEASALAQQGTAVLIYDKRTVGYSTFQRDYSVLANDAIGGVSLLRSQPNVDPSMVGVFGVSEGAWVAPLAANRTKDIAYIVTDGAVGTSPVRQTAWSYTAWLNHAGVNSSLVQTMQTGARLLLSSGGFPEANFNVLPVWQKVKQPILMLWGDEDRQALPAESSRLITQALQHGHNEHYTVRFIANADHNLHVSMNNGYDHTSTVLASGYISTESSWITSLKTGLPPVSTEVAPEQYVHSAAIAPLKWYESRWLQAVAFVLPLVTFVGYLIVQRRLWRNESNHALRRPLFWLATAGLMCLFGFFVYFALLVVLAAGITGPVVLGNSVPWILLRIAAVTVVVMDIWTVWAWFHDGRKRVANRVKVWTYILLTVGTVSTIWSVYWGLLR